MYEKLQHNNKKEPNNQTKNDSKETQKSKDMFDWIQFSETKFDTMYVLLDAVF